MEPGLTSIIWPTMGRYKLARESMRTLIETTRGLDVEIVVVIDGDDAPSWNNIAPLMRGVNFRLMQSKARLGAVGAWNAGAAMSSGQWLVLAANDVIWLPVWLQMAHAALCEFPGSDGLAGLNDGIRDGARGFVCHWLVSRKTCIEVLGGVLLIPVYQHSYPDVEINERVRAAGRYVWAPHARIRHLHPVWGTRPADDLDRWVHERYEADLALYEQRRLQGFPCNYEAVLK